MTDPHWKKKSNPRTTVVQPNKQLKSVMSMHDFKVDCAQRSWWHQHTYINLKYHIGASS